MEKIDRLQFNVKEKIVSNAKILKLLQPYPKEQAIEPHI
jgi:hypothetical protein